VIESRSSPEGLAPNFFHSVDVAADVRPGLCVVVDTEEEFDWNAPLDRNVVGVSAAAEIWRLQRVLEPLGVKPTYVVDYPIATTREAARIFADLARQQRCEVGAHLHPWVNPPHREVVSGHASFACNLGAELEFEKISALRQAIVDGVGLVPASYKAGRYGLGPTSVAALEALEFDVDVSVNPHMDYTAIGGPSFAGFDAEPAFFGERRRLLEVPCTTGFIGIARKAGESLHRLASRPWATPLRAVGILARSGIVNRVMLSPEGSSLPEMQALTRALFRDGIRTFSLTFHSPSLKPGCTPYVRSLEERDRFLDTVGRYVRFFLDELHGVPTTPAAVFQQFSKGLPS
jgi:hypothetical protein